MGKLYTLDGKLLVDTPELRVGDKLYPVDNRMSTFKKISKLSETEDPDQMGNADKILSLIFGAKAVKEMDIDNLPYPAYSQLFKLAMAAVTGEEMEDIEARFQGDNAKN